MLTCHVEEPLKPNEALTAFDERSGDIRLCDFGHDQLNRYSFTWQGAPEETGAAYGRVLGEMAERLEGSVSWILVQRPHVSGNYRIRYLRWLARRRSEGWSLHVDDTLGLAMRPVERERPDALNFARFGWPEGTPILLIDPGASPERLASEAPRPSLEIIAQGTSPCPSRAFLDWLAENKATVAYFRSDDLGRARLIVVTPACNRIAKLHECRVPGVVNSSND